MATDRSRFEMINPHEPGATSNVEHPTPNIEWQLESSVTSAFDVRCFSLGSGGSTREFSFRGNISPRERENRCPSSSPDSATKSRFHPVLLARVFQRHHPGGHSR